MSKYPHKDLPLKKTQLKKTPYTKKIAPKGSKHTPAKVRVQTEQRHDEVKELFEANKWVFEISIDPDQDEDIRDLIFLQNRQPTTLVEKTQKRNDPCACGSGKKYKKCCALN